MDVLGQITVGFSSFCFKLVSAGYLSSFINHRSKLDFPYLRGLGWKMEKNSNQEDKPLIPSAFYGPGVLRSASRITAQRNHLSCKSNFYIIHCNTLAPITLTKQPHDTASTHFCRSSPKCEDTVLTHGRESPAYSGSNSRNLLNATTTLGCSPQPQLPAADNPQ